MIVANISSLSNLKISLNMHSLILILNRNYNFSSSKVPCPHLTFSTFKKYLNVPNFLNFNKIQSNT